MKCSIKFTSKVKFCIIQSILSVNNIGIQKVDGSDIEVDATDIECVKDTLMSLGDFFNLKLITILSDSGSIELKLHRSNAYVVENSSSKQYVDDFLNKFRIPENFSFDNENNLVYTDTDLNLVYKIKPLRVYDGNNISKIKEMLDI